MYFCVGVVLASIGAGLGEFTFLSLAAHFDKSVASILSHWARMLTSWLAYYTITVYY